MRQGTPIARAATAPQQATARPEADVSERRPSKRRLRPQPAALALVALALLASCEREPSKSDYVSARVRETCAGLETTEELQACRLAVINEFKDMPFEEMKRRYPEPEPRSRPSCGLW